MASITKENYLKALFYLHQKNEQIALSDLSAELDVSRPTASDMVKKLNAKGFVNSAPYKPIKLTEKGITTAAGVIRKHRLSELFLLQIMDFGWEEVHDIAEELEHIKTEKLFDRMDELLGFPTTDPHGSPIPDKNGKFVKPGFKRLTQIQEGTHVELMALRDSSTSLLLFLNKKKLTLGTRLKVKAVEAFDGSYTVSYNEMSEVLLSKSVCDCLLVEER